VIANKQDSRTQSSKHLLLCKVIANEFHPTMHKVSLQTSKAIILPKTRASCYSHRLSQSALCETNWLFRVSRCNPYLNPYLIIYTTTPPWNLTKRFMELRPSHPTPPWNLTKSFMKLHQSHTTTMSLQPTTNLSSIIISCQHPTNQPTMFHDFIHIKLINSSTIISYRTYKASYLNFLKQQTIQSLKTYMYPTNSVNLAQAEKLSLRREEPLTQATSSRLRKRLQTESTSRSRSS